MQILWCWQCQRDMPMLDEHEYAAIDDLCKQELSDPDNSLSYQEFRAFILDQYARWTGLAETNVNAVFHHRLSLYGPPCHACGKPLRTPRAKLCAACWTRVPGSSGG